MAPLIVRVLTYRQARGTASSTEIELLAEVRNRFEGLSAAHWQWHLIRRTVQQFLERAAPGVAEVEEDEDEGDDSLEAADGETVSLYRNCEGAIMVNNCNDPIVKLSCMLLRSD
jgi:hypothetical protein